MLDTVFFLSVFWLYVVVAIVSGYNIAYRVLHKKKLCLYETLLSVLTLPLSFFAFALSFLGMIAFASKRINDGWKRIR